MSIDQSVYRLRQQQDSVLALAGAALAHVNPPQQEEGAASSDLGSLSGIPTTRGSSFTAKMPPGSGYHVTQDGSTNVPLLADTTYLIIVMGPNTQAGGVLCIAIAQYQQV